MLPTGPRPRRASITAQVHSVVEVTRSMVEVRLRAVEFTSLRFSPASHIIVRVPAPGGQTARRVYSVWMPDRFSGIIRLRVFLHAGSTPGSLWAQHVAKDDKVLVEPPRTKIAPHGGARYHLLLGDETAAVPLQSIQAALYHSPHTYAPIHGVLESVDGSTEVPGASEVPALPWVHRGHASAVGSAVLVAAARELTLPREHGTAYVAGESLTCQMLRDHLVKERGWPRNAVKMQPQWASGWPGFGAGRKEQTRP